jgi:hypothetical protein
MVMNAFAEAVTIRSSDNDHLIYANQAALESGTAAATDSTSWTRLRATRRSRVG